MKLPCGEGRVGCDLAGKRQLRLLESDRRLHEFDHVDYIRQIVEDQLSQGLAVATPVAVPEPDCLETVHTLDCRVSPVAQRPLHSLQPAPITPLAVRYTEMASRKELRRPDTRCIQNELVNVSPFHSYGVREASPYRSLCHPLFSAIR